jgi:putative hydrolase of the HAD superfamily
MTIRAVIFDLFGTLVEQPPLQPVRRAMAQALGIPFAQFDLLWEGTSFERNTGVFPTIEANIEHVCRSLGLRVPMEQVERAVAIRLEMTREALTPRPDALKTLAALKEAGCDLGLISNCTPSEPELWGETPLARLINAPVFSCKVGILKPDERIFRLASQALDAHPQECMYIADSGVQGELEAASQLGMRSVLVRSRYRGEGGRPGRFMLDETQWHGPRIATLEELVPLVRKGQ